MKSHLEHSSLYCMPQTYLNFEDGRNAVVHMQTSLYGGAKRSITISFCFGCLIPFYLAVLANGEYCSNNFVIIKIVLENNNYNNRSSDLDNSPFLYQTNNA